jgi:hypothetical protein
MSHAYGSYHACDGVIETGSSVCRRKVLTSKVVLLGIICSNKNQIRCNSPNQSRKPKAAQAASHI